MTELQVMLRELHESFQLSYHVPVVSREKEKEQLFHYWIECIKNHRYEILLVIL